MEIVPLPQCAVALRRYVEELWIPYNRELAGLLEDFDLVDSVDLVDVEANYRLERLADDGEDLWVAVDPPETAGTPDPLEHDLIGFITTTVDAAPPVFDQPDRLLIGDLYVCPAHRGTGLAERLLETAGRRAREVDIDEVVLEVDVKNRRARAFYERCGFEAYRYTLGIDTDALVQ